MMRSYAPSVSGLQKEQHMASLAEVCLKQVGLREKQNTSLLFLVEETV